MGIASLRSRLARIDARSPNITERGEIGARFGRMIADLAKPGHLIWAESPGGFDRFAAKQQADLLAELHALE